jgi:hypothetical protein
MLVHYRQFFLVHLEDSMRPILLMMSALVLCACGGEPLSEAQVVTAWNSLVAESCNGRVTFSDVAVVDRSVEGPVATVLVNVRGRWAGNTVGYAGIPVWDEIYSGACAGFSSRSEPRSMQRRMTFRRFEKGWRFESLDDGTTLRMDQGHLSKPAGPPPTADEAREALASRVEPAGSVDSVGEPLALSDGTWSVEAHVTETNACPVSHRGCGPYTGPVVARLARQQDTWTMTQLFYSRTNQYESNVDGLVPL